MSAALEPDARVLTAPAKVNLCLFLGPVREDGLHELCSVFAPISLRDRLTVLDGEGEADEVICPGVEQPDLTARALAALREAGWRRAPLRIVVDKRIPVAAGLGGGSADAAAVLRLATDDLPDSELERIAAALGADVPSQIDPRFSLVGGAGERVAPLPEPDPFAIVLLPDPEGLSTPEVFAEADRLGLPRPAAELEARRAELAAAFAERRSPLELGDLLTNDLAEAAISLRPRTAEAVAALEEAGAPVARVTGSGPTAFGLFPSRDEAERAAMELEAGRPEGDRRPIGNGGLMELPHDRKGWLKLIGFLVLLFVAYQLVKRALPDIDAQQVLEDASDKLGAWTYPLVGLLAFLETGAFVGLIAPGETFVVLAGAVAGQGETSVVLTIGIVWACAFLGDTASYILGVRLGRGFIIEHGPKLRITRERFAQVESYFDRHGGKTILIGRFIGLVRALAPFIAGSSHMQYRAMAPYSVLGTGIWATTFTLLGFYASKNIDAVLSNSEHALLAFAAIVGLIVGVTLGVRYLREPENRAKLAREMEARPVLRNILAVGRRVSPQAKFLAGRVTPGDLGLELTTALAALAVGSYVCIALGMLVHDNPGATVTDRAAFDFVDRIEVSWLTDLAKIVTALGSTPAILLASLAAGVWLGYRRYWLELAILVLGVIVILVGTPLIKDAVDRPRPSGALIDASGSSYPSGHASHAVVYAWIALMISVRTKAGITRGTAIVLAGVALAVLIGLSRIYLRVHYLSDVSGGWAYGVSAFALFAALAILISYFRQDGERVD